MSSRISFNKPKTPRNLEEICKGTKAEELVGEKYCMLKPTKPLLCKYREKKPDHNGLYKCYHCKETDEELN